MEIVADLVAATGGWPAAVRLALDSLENEADPARRTALFTKAFRPGGDVYAYLAGEALADATEPVRELLRRLSPFDRISVELCTALGVPDTEEAMAALLKRGLVAELPDGGQLWPDADPPAAGNRMSVALSTARAVLDPERQ